MPVTMEMIGSNIAQFTVEIEPETLEPAIEHQYKRMGAKYVVPGFRRGKAPRKLIERFFGNDVFAEDAAIEAAIIEYHDFIRANDLRPIEKAEAKSIKLDEGQKAIVELTVYLLPDYSKLKYKGLMYPVIESNITDDDVDKAIENVRQRNARIISVSDRPAQIGDDVVIDFEGFIYNMAFEGGNAEDFSLKLGSNSFIEGFEQQICGHEIDDFFDVFVTFPENYGEGTDAEELAGKPARFEVRIKSISFEELPELSDEFAQDVSEYDTFDEYRDSIRAQLNKKEMQDIEKIKREALIKEFLEKNEMEIPPDMIEDEVQRSINDLVLSLSRKGMSLEQYLYITSNDFESFHANEIAHAKRQIKYVFLLEAVIRAENIEVSPEEIKEFVEEKASEAGISQEEYIEQQFDNDSKLLSGSVARVKAFGIVKEHALPILFDDQTEQTEQTEQPEQFSQSEEDI